jgi:hypothetical protein
MIRVLAFNAVFFVLPFAIYAAWLAIARGGAGGPADWTGRRILALSAGGLVLMAVAMVAFGAFRGAPPGGTYKPATIEDGRIVPGHID